MISVPRLAADGYHRNRARRPCSHPSGRGAKLMPSSIRDARAVTRERELLATAPDPGRPAGTCLKRAFHSTGTSACLTYSSCPQRQTHAGRVIDTAPRIADVICFIALALLAT